MDKAPANLYPKLTLTHIKNPNKLWAIPFFGFVAKVVILLPVWIWLIILFIAAYVLSVVNSFVVLFTGEYMESSYKLNLGLMRLATISSFFLFGLTDRYPGFGFKNDDPLLKYDIEKPKNPNRLFAFPFLGGVVRFILMIPFFIYGSVLGNASWLGVALSSFVVLFKGRYPESTYELMRDYMRVSNAMGVYVAGLSDKYPSFWISMNHKTIKILLIIAGALETLGNWFSKSSSSSGY